MPPPLHRSAAPSLLLRFKKRGDGSATLTLVRADGSSCSQSVGPANAYGPTHDLTHYAIESVLGFTDGFLGLCAAGLDFTSFEKGAKEFLPAEAFVAEVMAGELSRLVMMRQESTLGEFNWAIGEGVCSWGSGARARQAKAWPQIERWRAGVDRPAITQEQYDAIRRLLARLRAEWGALGDGATYSLEFVPGRAVNVSVEGKVVPSG
jgi:hypothetical protein